MHLLQEVDYDPVRNAAYWNLRPIFVFSRALEIGKHFVSGFLHAQQRIPNYLQCLMFQHAFLIALCSGSILQVVPAAQVEARQSY